MTEFPVKSFREALQDTKSLQIKLSKSFLIQSRRQNMVWIEGITEQFLRIFSTKESIKIKLNAIYGIQYFVQLAEYPVMTLFEVYILPTVLQIALFGSPNQTFQKTSQYFNSQGYSSSTPNIKQLSHNYVILAQNFIFNCAFIKPFRTFQSLQMNQPSEYQKAALKLNKAGIKQRNFSQDQVQEMKLWRQNFIVNLNKFDNDSQTYVSYYIKKIESYVNEGSNFKKGLDFRKIMKYGDVFLTSEVIGHCCQALQNNDFHVKKNALGLINDFVIWGDIEAIMMINYAEYIQEIFSHIAQVNGQLSFSAGQKIYPQIHGEKEAKKIFYIQFLKCLQTWAMCIPKTNFDNKKTSSQDDQQFSPVFLLYLKLKNQRQFKFPQNDLLPKYKKQLEQNLKINKERNDLILRQLQQNAQETLSISKHSLKPLNKFQKYKSKNSLIKQQRQSEFVTSSQIQKYIKSAQNLMHQLLLSVQNNRIQKAQEIMGKLNQFCDNFQSKLEAIEESIDEDGLENLYRQGINRIQRIICINDHFEDFKSEKINLMKLQELIRYEINKRLSENTESRYMEDYRSRKSKRSSMSKSYGTASQNMLIQSSNKSIELKNFSHDRFKVPVQNNMNVKNIENEMPQKLTQKQSKSQVSKSTEKNIININKNKNGREQEKQEDQGVEEEQGSYDFQMQDYGFVDVRLAQNHSKVKQKSHIKSQKQSKKSIQNSKITNSKKESKISQANIIKSSQASIQIQQSHQSININKSLQSSTNSKKQQIVKVQNINQEQKNINRNTVKLANNQNNFLKSKKISSQQQSPSLIVNHFRVQNNSLRKESSQIVSIKNSSQLHEDKKSKISLINAEQNKSDNFNHNPHNFYTSSQPKQLTSFNMTQIVGFSKAPPSSVDRISSIQQKKFKVEILNSQQRQIFQDGLSEYSENLQHKKIKQQLHDQQNPGFDIVFKNRSKIKSNKDKAQQYSQIKSNLSNNGQLRSSRQTGNQQKQKQKQNSQIKQTTKTPIIIRANKLSLQQQKVPLIERYQQQQKLFRNSDYYQNQMNQQQRKIIIDANKSGNSKKTESLRRKDSLEESSLSKSGSSRRSLRKSERVSFVKKQPQLQGLMTSRSEQNHFITINNAKKHTTQSHQNILAQKHTPIQKPRQYFSQSSFMDQQSQDTPNIMQRSKEYYYNNNNQIQSPQVSKRLQSPMTFKKPSSPKHQRISFANSSQKHNISSKSIISEKDEKEEYDKSNFSQSQYRKSNQNTHQQRFYQNDYGLPTSKSKTKSIFSQNKSLWSKLESRNSQMKKKISAKKNIQYLANKQLQQIRMLKERLQQLEKDSKNYMQFQRSSIKSPQIPRYAVSPRSPRFRQNSNSVQTLARQRVSFTNSSEYMSPQTKRNFDLNSSFSRQYLITPYGKLINKSNYAKYFEQLRLHLKNNQNMKNPKKRLLRNKQLIHKNENIEIGVTTLRQRNRLRIIYFVTPQRPIEKFTIKIQQVKKFKIKCSQNEIIDMKPKTQYKIYINCEILEFPYLMPKIQFMYKNQNKTVHLGQKSTPIVPQTKLQMLLPVYFLKFIEFRPISGPQLSQVIQGKPVFRTQEFPLDSRIIKRPTQINDYIPNLNILSQTSAMTIYCGKGCFFSHNFIYKINFKMNHFVYIQAISLQQNDRFSLSQQIIEWFLVCMQELLAKQIHLKSY